MEHDQLNALLKALLARNSGGAEAVTAARGAPGPPYGQPHGAHPQPPPLPSDTSSLDGDADWLLAPTAPGLKGSAGTETGAWARGSGAGAPPAPSLRSGPGRAASRRVYDIGGDAGGAPAIFTGGAGNAPAVEPSALANPYSFSSQASAATPLALRGGYALGLGGGTPFAGGRPGDSRALAAESGGNGLHFADNIFTDLLHGNQPGAQASFYSAPPALHPPGPLPPLSVNVLATRPGFGLAGPLAGGPPVCSSHQRQQQQQQQRDTARLATLAQQQAELEALSSAVAAEQAALYQQMADATAADQRKQQQQQQQQVVAWQQQQQMQAQAQALAEAQAQAQTQAHAQAQLLQQQHAMLAAQQQQHQYQMLQLQHAQHYQAQQQQQQAHAAQTASMPFPPTSPHTYQSELAAGFPQQQQQQQRPVHPQGSFTTGSVGIASAWLRAAPAGSQQRTPPSLSARTSTDEVMSLDMARALVRESMAVTGGASGSRTPVTRRSEEISWAGNVSGGSTVGTGVASGGDSGAAADLQPPSPHNVSTQGKDADAPKRKADSLRAGRAAHSTATTFGGLASSAAAAGLDVRAVAREGRDAQVRTLAELTAQVHALLPERHYFRKHKLEVGLVMLAEAGGLLRRATHAQGPLAAAVAALSVDELVAPLPPAALAALDVGIHGEMHFFQEHVSRFLQHTRTWSDAAPDLPGCSLGGASASVSDVASMDASDLAVTEEELAEMRVLTSPVAISRMVRLVHPMDPRWARAAAFREISADPDGTCAANGFGRAWPGVVKAMGMLEPPLSVEQIEQCLESAAKQKAALGSVYAQRRGAAAAVAAALDGLQEAGPVRALAAAGLSGAAADWSGVLLGTDLDAALAELEDSLVEEVKLHVAGYLTYLDAVEPAQLLATVVHRGRIVNPWTLAESMQQAFYDGSIPVREPIQLPPPFGAGPLRTVRLRR